MATHVLEAGGHVWPFPLIEIQKVISGLPGGDRRLISTALRSPAPFPSWQPWLATRLSIFEKWVVPTRRLPSKRYNPHLRSPSIALTR